MAAAAFGKSTAKAPRLVSELDPGIGPALGALRRRLVMEQSLPPDRCMDPTQPGCAVEEPGPTQQHGSGVFLADLVLAPEPFQGVPAGAGCMDRPWPPLEPSVGQRGVRALPWRPPAR
jgi:hypothetical protein